MLTHPARIARLVERCAWCGIHLMPDMRVLIAGGKFSDWSPQLEMLRGRVVRVRASQAERTVHAVVPLPNTAAHSAGYDLLFVLCGVECRDALDAAIANEPMTLSIEDASLPAESPAGCA